MSKIQPKFLVLFALLLIPAVTANEGSIKLLAVSEGPDGVHGSPAELHLEIRPGNGRVLMDSQPAPKLDTLISTRFANQIACKFAEVDCHQYDFSYTIIADSSIIGGPSAGAAVAILTVAMLEGLPLNQSVAATGTISSGGLIGPVGYVHSKLDAAKESGAHTVLVAESRELLEGSNLSIDLVTYGKELGINVVVVPTLADALEQYTGKSFRTSQKPLLVDPAYNRTMQQVATELCNRSTTFQKSLAQVSSGEQHRKESAENNTAIGLALLAQGRSYSAASMCFGANVQYATMELNKRSTNLAERQVKTEAERAQLEQYMATYPLRTITDLETAMAITDRLQEGRDSLNASAAWMEKGDRAAAAESLAYGQERIRSAYAWSRFLGLPGKRLKIDQTRLAASCLAKLEEVQEHYEYLQLFFPGVLADTAADIADSREQYHDGEYLLCLVKTTLAKAEVNVVLSSMGVDAEDLPKYLSTKLAAAETLIAQDQAQGIFPLLGYSYLLYAQDLQKRDPQSALLYAEYALELSNLDPYFSNGQLHITGDFREPFLFAAGIVLGLLFGIRFRNRRGPRLARRRARRVR